MSEMQCVPELSGRVLRWNDGQALPVIPLVWRAVDAGLGCPARILTEEDVRERRVVFILGEHSSGLNAALAWWVEKLGPLSRKWARARSDAPEPWGVALGGGSPDGVAAQFAELLSGDERRVREGLHAMGGSGAEPIHVLLRVAREDGAHAADRLMALAKGIRAFIDAPGNGKPPVRITISAPSFAPWALPLAQSGLETVSTIVRTMPFRSVDVLKLAQAYDLHILDSAQAEDIVWITGGQPRLVHLVLERLAARAHFEEIRRVLANSGEAVIGLWKSELRELLGGANGDNRPRELRERTRGYVRGEALPPHEVPDEMERELFVAGWVGRRPDGTWGVRGGLHRHWAAQVFAQEGWL